MWDKTVARLFWLVWVASAVIALTYPMSDFVRHPHWDGIEWVPFTRSPLERRDMAANFVCFVPGGFLYFWSRRGTRAIAPAVLWALAISLAGEVSQVFRHHRHPSMTDLLMNTTGAWAGACAASVLHRLSVRLNARA